MPTDIVVLPHVVIQGNLTIAGNKPLTARTDMQQNANDRYQIPATAWRIWDAIQTPLSTAANDDLGIVGGTFGTASPAIQTGDLKATTTTRRARVIFALPPEYDTAQSVTIRAHAGMVTTIADATTTIDFEAYRMDRETGIGSDLVATSAQSMNDLTDADIDFVVTPATLAPGDLLDIRMSITVTDAATATAVIGSVGAVEILIDTKG